MKEGSNMYAKIHLHMTFLHEESFTKTILHEGTLLNEKLYFLESKKYTKKLPTEGQGNSNGTRSKSIRDKITHVQNPPDQNQSCQIREPLTDLG